MARREGQLLVRPSDYIFAHTKIAVTFGSDSWEPNKKHATKSSSLRSYVQTLRIFNLNTQAIFLSMSRPDVIIHQQIPYMLIEETQHIASWDWKSVRQKRYHPDQAPTQERGGFTQACKAFSFD
jgi:hypothetical protein